jgi:hypothetical protein
MSYFQIFPTLLYSFANENNGRYVTDIMRRVKVRDMLLDEATLYDLYFVRDGETPDVLASKMYGDSELHWVLMHTNKIIDPMFEWPLSSVQLNAYIEHKYGANKYNIHHYELSSPLEWRNGMYMPSPAEFATFDPEYTAKLFNDATEEINPITNAEYEEKLNDDKREIRIFRRELLNDFIKEITTLIAA